MLGDDDDNDVVDLGDVKIRGGAAAALLAAFVGDAPPVGSSWATITTTGGVPVSMGARGGEADSRNAWLRIKCLPLAFGCKCVGACRCNYAIYCGHGQITQCVAVNKMSQ